MNSWQIFVLIASVLYSLYLSVGIVRRPNKLYVKILSLVFVYIPIIGPVFYSIVIGTPKRQPFIEQDRRNRFTHLDSRVSTNFKDRWDARRPELEKKIRKLREADKDL